MVAILAHQQVREQADAGHAAIDGPVRCWRLDDCAAARAGELGANVANDMEATQLLVECLRDVLTDFAQAATTGLAVAAAARRVRYGAPRKTIWQLVYAGAMSRLTIPAGRLDGRDVGMVLIVFGADALSLRQCWLRDLAAYKFRLRVLELLAGVAILHATQVRHFDLELLDGEQHGLQCLLGVLYFAAESGVAGKQFLRGHGRDCSDRTPTATSGVVLYAR